MLKNIQRSENYTCQAASKLALIENTTQIRVQGIKNETELNFNEFELIVAKNPLSF